MVFSGYQAATVRVMFEQSPDEMRATVHVDERESILADQHGVRISAGSVALTFREACSLARKLDDRLAGWKGYKRQEKQLRALRNSIVWAFGPDAEARVGDLPECDHDWQWHATGAGAGHICHKCGEYRQP